MKKFFFFEAAEPEGIKFVPGKARKIAAVLEGEMYRAYLESKQCSRTQILCLPTV